MQRWSVSPFELLWQKYHRLGGLNNTLICHSSGGWDIQGQGAGWFGSLWGSSWFVVGCLLLCLHMAEILPLVSLFVRALIPSVRIHPHDLFTSQRSYLQIPSPRGLGLQYMNLRGGQNIQSIADGEGLPFRNACNLTTWNGLIMRLWPGSIQDGCVS